MAVEGSVEHSEIQQGDSQRDLQRVLAEILCGVSAEAETEVRCLVLTTAMQ